MNELHTSDNTSDSQGDFASFRFGARDICYLLILVSATWGIRLWFIQFYRVISADGTAFAGLARAISQGSLLDALSSAQPPFYPLMIACVHLFVDDIESAGRITAAFAGGLVLVPLYILAARLGDRRTAVISCLLVAVWPSIRHWSCEVMSQSTYMVLIFSAFLSYWRMLLQPTVSNSCLTASLFAFSYLTRPEAFIPFVLLFAYHVAYQAVKVKLRWREIAWQTACYWLVFIIIVSPYIIRIRIVTGKWQLSAKSASVIGAALQEYLGRPDLYHEIGYKGFSLWDIVQKYPDFVTSNAAKNVLIVYRDLPLYIWLPAILGLVICYTARAKIPERLWILLTFAPLSLIVTFYMLGPEYTQFFWPILFIFFAIGLVWIEMRIRGLISSIFPSTRLLKNFSFSVAIALALALYLLNSQIPDAAARNKPYTPEDDGGRYDHKLIGLRLKKVLPEGSKIMTRSGRIIFYSGLEGPLYPQASLAEILAVARENGVRFLVVDGSLVYQRPQLGILLNPLINGPESVDMISNESMGEVLPQVKMYYLYKNPSSQGVVVYELL